MDQLANRKHLKDISRILSVYAKPAKSQDLGRRLPAFSLQCRLSGFDVHFTGEIKKNMLAVFRSSRVDEFCMMLKST